MLITSSFNAVCKNLFMITFMEPSAFRIGFRYFDLLGFFFSRAAFSAIAFVIVFILKRLLVMSLPDTPETRNTLSRERIALLPEDAYVVNVGRGSAIDEDALADSLDSGRLAGAALDVFRTEPLPEDSRLWNTRNLLITPHVAGNLTADHTIGRNVEMFCEDLDNYASGRQLRYLVDRSLGY